MAKTLRTFRYHPGAVEDIRQGFLWYLRQSPSSAENFKRELKRAEEIVLLSSEVWPSHVHGTRRFILNGFPYGLVFLNEAETVVGLAVAHFKRKPDYWKQRLEG